MCIRDSSYAAAYPETYDPNTADEYVYAGPAKLTDKISIGEGKSMEVGKLLLSPTRTFLPLLHAMVKSFGSELNGIIHNTGGGQSKASKFLRGTRLVKDDLLPLPPLFSYIAEVNDMTPHELYQVYNMGTRLEAYMPAARAEEAIAIAKGLSIDAKVIGRVTDGESGVEVKSHNGEKLWYPAG